MRNLLAMALSGAAIAVSGPAAAQSCSALVNEARDAVYTVPEDRFDSIGDRLNDLMNQTDAMDDGDPRCSCVVKQMNDLVRQGGGTVNPAYAGSCSGDAAGRPGGQPSGPVANNDSDDADADRDGDDTRTPMVRYGDLTDAELQKILRELDPTYSRENAILATDYINRAKAAQAVLKDAEAAYGGKAPATLTRAGQALDEVKDISLEIRSIVINDDQDVLHAQLEDALRRTQNARMRYKRNLAVWTGLVDQQEDDLIAPLTNGASEDDLIAPLDDMIAPLDDMIAPLVDPDGDLIAPLVPDRKERIKAAKKKARTAYNDLLKAEASVKLIRNRIDENILYTGWNAPFIDMRPGYREAFAAIEAKEPARAAQIDAACKVSPERCTSEWAKFPDYQREYKQVFDRYVVPLPYPVKVPAYYPKR